MELEVTWKRTIRIWWSYLWRNLIAMVVALLIGALIGFVIGFVMGMLGFSIRTIQFVTAPLGFIVGLGISIVPLKMILGKDFGEFRLILLANPDAQSAGTLQQTSTEDRQIDQVLPLHNLTQPL